MNLSTLQAPTESEIRYIIMVQMVVHSACAVAAGGTANWLLFRRARAATRLVELQQLPAAESMSLLAKIGGVNPVITAVLAVVAFVLIALQAASGLTV
jgi:hypothetical protein